MRLFLSTSDAIPSVRLVRTGLVVQANELEVELTSSLDTFHSDFDLVSLVLVIPSGDLVLLGPFGSFGSPSSCA